jgi:hypothetical protein
LKTPRAADVNSDRHVERTIYGEHAVVDHDGDRIACAMEGPAGAGIDLQRLPPLKITVRGLSAGVSVKVPDIRVLIVRDMKPPAAARL